MHVIVEDVEMVIDVKSHCLVPLSNTTVDLVVNFTMLLMLIASCFVKTVDLVARARRTIHSSILLDRN